MEDPGFDRLEIESREALRAWLAEHHATSDGLWLTACKKAAGPERWVPIEAIIEELLCVGWVDHKIRAVDELRTSLRCMPRRARSTWGPRNAIRAQRMIDAGLMRPAGLAQVQDAKARGVWPG